MNSYATISFFRQCFYLLLHLAGLVCGLWMVHDPIFTFAMLALAPVSLLISRIPMKFFPVAFRQILQLGYGFAGVYWLQRYLPEKPVSLLMVEFGCIIFPALYLLRSRREHNIMLFGVMGIVFYGSLQPNRSVFFPSFLCVLLLFVLLLYHTRISFLGLKSGSSQQIVSPDQKYRGNPGYRFCHFLCSLVLALFCISQFSLTRRIKTAGIIPGEWKVRQELKFPKFWAEWTAPVSKYLPSLDGRTLRDASQELPPVLDEKQDGDRLVSGQGGSTRLQNGSGSSMGDQLVFRAVVPARMYWMVQAYDTYDGSQWLRSPIMKRGRSGLDTFEPREYYTLPQNIVMERPVSRLLPYVYKPYRLNWNDEMGGNVPPGVIRRRDHILYELLNQNLPALPWKYSVISYLPNPQLDSRRLAVTDPRARNLGWNYLQLPRTRISGRMRRLARELTAGTDDKMEKATILRDYLKNHFKYTLSPGKIPEGAEVCDYFLFESREGYCQHFAQALTILARLSGLQARLVVGYSPGNYNFLMDCFEVYEYHGHAWSQIFIEPFGWLTFDGTPPGVIPDVAGPKILQKLLDPFGERRDSRPPEISFLPPGAAVKPEKERLEAESAGVQTFTLTEVQQKAAQVYDKIYEAAMKEHPEHDPGMKDLLKSGGSMLLRKLRAVWAQIRASVLRWKDSWRKFLQQKGRELTVWLKQLSVWDWGCSLVLLAAGLRLWSSRRRIYRQLERLARIWSCRRLWKKVQAGCYQDRRLVQICQMLIFSRMELSGIRRMPSQDLLEYGEALRRRLPECTGDYELVAECACQCLYSCSPVSPEQCGRVVQATRRLLASLCAPPERRRNAVS